MLISIEGPTFCESNESEPNLQQHEPQYQRTESKKALLPTCHWKTNRRTRYSRSFSPRPLTSSVRSQRLRMLANLSCYTNQSSDSHPLLTSTNVPAASNAYCAASECMEFFLRATSGKRVREMSSLDNRSRRVYTIFAARMSSECCLQRGAWRSLAELWCNMSAVRCLHWLSERYVL